LSKLRYHADKQIFKRAYFYRDKSQREVDVIQWNGIHLSAYEIKSGISYKSDFFKNLDYLKSLLNDRINRSAVIYDGDTESHQPERGIYNFRNFCL
jgi:hypothetical protein